MGMSRRGRGATRQNHIAGLIARLGGQHRVSAGLGLSQAAISGWVVRGLVPSHNIPRVIAFGLRLDPPVPLTPCDFFALDATRPGCAACCRAKAPAEAAPGVDPSPPTP